MDATQREHDYTQIKGWGVDANRQNDPTYPMKRRNNGEHVGYSWDRPSLQPATVEVLHSNERPNLTAVFGTSSPPAGLSGILRRFAFRFSESSYGHWLPLMLADRISVVEGMLGDLRHGHIPNILAERGIRAEWRYSRSRLLLRGLLRVAVIGAAIAYLRSRET